MTVSIRKPVDTYRFRFDPSSPGYRLAVPRRHLARPELLKPGSSGGSVPPGQGQPGASNPDTAIHTASVPEPATGALALTALIVGLVAARRRSRSKLHSAARRSMSPLQFEAGKGIEAIVRQEHEIKPGERLCVQPVRGVVKVKPLRGCLENQVRGREHQRFR
jgi:hypothetical protein